MMIKNAKYKIEEFSFVILHKKSVKKTELIQTQQL